jgi:6,7-dimethyl-8-ribityllumazine synthase
MLKAISKKRGRATGEAIAIVASRYNARYVDAMLRAARAELKQAGVGEVKVVRVPGAFEIPVVAAVLARSESPQFAAILCLGVVIRGETAHADLIGSAVSQALANIQVETAVPIIHEVLLLANEQQAEVRCLGKTHNRGAEAARTALEMARVMKTLR